MTPEQGELLRQARSSLDAAKVLQTAGHHGYAASRAYYTMFYTAEALLLSKGLAFSKHSGVHAAFGEHFVKTGIISPEFHGYLIRGLAIRHQGDYGEAQAVTVEAAEEQIAHAQEFVKLAECLLAHGHS